MRRRVLLCRVVAAFCISCGQCQYCKAGLTSSCDATNPNVDNPWAMQNVLYGHCTCGMYGYSHLTGGWEGGQARNQPDSSCLQLSAM